MLTNTIETNIPKILNFPANEVRLSQKLEQLTLIKQHYLELQEMEEELFEMAIKITGEIQPNGHTLDFLSNNPNLTATDLLHNMAKNPSNLWKVSE